ncbi:MAG: HlyC/CorC family transporter [Planctomycetes bacterium]|nr:HlyC/CorC family transporter [Planctomycetota bacterium]
MESENLFYIGLALILLAANAFFVAAEFALVGLRRTKIEELVQEGSRPAERVKAILANLNDCLSTCQVGITLASLGLGWIGEASFEKNIEALFVYLNIGQGPAAVVSAHAISFLLAFLCITFLHVVLGEQSPKIVAIQFPEALAMWIAWPMRYFNKLFFPLVWILNGSTRAVLGVFGLKAQPAHARVHSEEELGMILDESHKAGLMSPEERKMLERVFAFHDKTVKEIMTPRPDIVALDLRTPEGKVADLAFKEGYSRLPVFDGNLDKIVGIVYVKDLLYTIRDPKLIKIADLIREHIEISETYSVSLLLRDFQRRRIHMAIVVDEFGATAGLVTLEDIVEEIVGEIQDEHDEEKPEVEKLADGAVLFDGKAHLDKFREVFAEVELPEGGFETVAGLVLHLAGRVPTEGDTVRLGEYVLRVAQRDGRRIKKIAVRKVPLGATQTFAPLNLAEAAPGTATPGSPSDRRPMPEEIVPPKKAKAPAER